MPTKPTKPASNPIDALMDRASEALGGARYFEGEALCLRAMSKALAARDFERLARLVLPLHECRRWRRQEALDACERGGAWIVEDRRALGRIDAAPGCYLVQPPMLGIEARDLREVLLQRKAPALVVAREPLTRDGLWPIVAVLPNILTIRTKVTPPTPMRRVEARAAKDEPDRPPPASWFASAAEALGDAAIARLKPSDPAAHRVEDLAEFLDAHPDHEKLHQRLEEACRAATHEPEPTLPRRRPTIMDPYSF